MPAGTSAESKARKRFLQEARSASSLNHPNIVTIHSIENYDGNDFIVMEYVEGKKLNYLLAEGPISISDLLEFARQIAEALSLAHSAGIIHRDIKADNILITSRGLVKVLDFGLAKAVMVSNSADLGDAETLEQITEAGTLLGTVHYMSPEQTRGETLDARSDVFSFGCVLYQCVTRKLPFQGGTVPAILYQVTNVDPPPPSAYRKDLPAGIDALIKRALAKNRNLRFANGEEMAIEIRRIKDAISAKHSTHIAPEEENAPSDLVGRDEQNDQLHALMEKMLQGKGVTVLISGEPGIGKTSLAEDSLRTAKIRFPEVVIGRGRCVEQYGTAQAYLPFSEAIGGLLNGPDRERLIGALRLHAPTWHVQFPAAFESTGAIERSRTESMGANKERMLRELVNALFHFAASSPLVLFLEDLHWADPSSVDLLRYLSQAISGERLMILGTLRSEEVERANAPLKAALLEMRSHHLIDEIPLGLLNEQDIRKLLDSRFLSNSFSMELAKLIYVKTEGHPLFVTSLLEFLVSQQAIVKNGETWSLSEPVSEMKLHVPESVSSMIRRKLEALNDDDRKILQYASVEGEEFSSTVLADLLAADELELEEKLQRIRDVHAIVRATGEEELPDGLLATKYRFVHALYQNALYADLVTKRRIQLHRSIGESLLKHSSGKAESIANLLGEHFRLGRDFERASEYLQLAGDDAVAIYANNEAAELYQKAIEQANELLRRQSTEEKWRSTAADLHEKLGTVIALIGQQENARKEFEETLRLIPEANFIWSARLHRRIAKALETQQHFAEALKEYENAERLAERQESRSPEWWQEWLQIGLDRLWLHYTRNEVSQLESLTAKLQPFLQHGTPNQRVRFFSGVILASWRRDRYYVEDRHIENCVRCLEAARETGSLGEITNSVFVLGFAYLWKGEAEKALEYLNQALALTQKVGDLLLQSRCWIYVSVAHRRRKDPEATRESNAKALEIAGKANMKEYVATTLANEAWLALLEEKWETVIEKAQAAIAIWSSLALVYPFHGLALWPLIDAEVKQGRVEEALGHARFLLDPSQQKISERITSGLQKALADSDQQQLRAVLEFARAENHL